jgi:hypothetical protein
MLLPYLYIKKPNFPTYKHIFFSVEEREKYKKTLAPNVITISESLDDLIDDFILLIPDTRYIYHLEGSIQLSPLIVGKRKVLVTPYTQQQYYYLAESIIHERNKMALSLK